MTGKRGETGPEHSVADPRDYVQDGLIMIGLPLLQPHAWLAVATMILAIVAPLAIARHVRRPALA